MTIKDLTSSDEDSKKIRIGTFSHSSNIHEIASMIDEKVFRLHL